jgi:hypothetical protein
LKKSHGFRRTEQGIVQPPLQAVRQFLGGDRRFLVNESAKEFAPDQASEKAAEAGNILASGIGAT